MMFKKKKDWGENITDKIDRAIAKVKEDRIKYDEETKLQLEEIKNSDREMTWYLKEILWELRYMRRKANRP